VTENAIECYVEDATGERFLTTFARPEYEAAFRRHAAWWLGWVRSPARFRARGLDGRPLRKPVGRCHVRVIPYHDASQR